MRGDRFSCLGVGDERVVIAKGGGWTVEWREGFIAATAALYSVFRTRRTGQVFGRRGAVQSRCGGGPRHPLSTFTRVPKHYAHSHTRASTHTQSDGASALYRFISPSPPPRDHSRARRRLRRRRPLRTSYDDERA